MGAGALTITTGAIVNNNAKKPQIIGPGVEIAAFGVLASLASIPFFVIGHKYKKRAIRIQLEQTKVTGLSIKDGMGVYQSTVSVKIPLL